ncbi:hypothetical protein DPMN_159502 [Dreissena polymorpha]|uniref:Uncharacterized protein n=1 Tax=Dreissena polymorpha TaxID=45954 RepID=A0A9D4ELQ4_DREPO|nr:hypothetical protein DPMN_159502 [Dreissena polymorpha]
MHMGIIQPIGEFVDELLIGNELVYRHSDWSTDSVPTVYRQSPDSLPTDSQQNNIPLLLRRGA